MAFIDARITESRLRGESFETLFEGEEREDVGFEPQTMRFEQTTEVGSSFTVSVDDTAAPTRASVSLDFSIQIKKKDDGARMASYNVKIDALFRIVKSEGVADWGSIPADVMAGMLAVLYQLAVLRAEPAFLAGGFRNFKIPTPAELSGEK
ncbi:hypothetical protein [Methyloversatilis sp. NSM2]|uniref:hypothetical protein n=1 Tax=Methyloversatilis sp. NSM2 TaxID=3134135 RepID=UPI0031141F56